MKKFLLLMWEAEETTQSNGHPRVSLGEAIAQLIAAKEKANLRPRYVRSLKDYLGMFARARSDLPLSKCDTIMIEKWFENRSEAPSTYAANLGRLSALFSFSVRRGWIERNPCDRIERVRVDRKPPRILTPREAGRLLCITRRREPSMLGYIVLGMLAGVRPEEIARLKWSDVDLQAGIVRIDAAASKVRQRRLVHLPEKARAWLAVAARNGDLVTPKSRRRRLRRIIHHARIKWQQDILRHTAASYLLALHQDAGRVALWLGNSPGILHRHYKELVSERECGRFWRT